MDKRDRQDGCTGRLILFSVRTDKPSQTKNDSEQNLIVNWIVTAKQITTYCNPTKAGTNLVNCLYLKNRLENFTTSIN